MESFTVIMKDLLQSELRPIKDNMASLSEQIAVFQTSLHEVTATANHADATATEALTKTNLVDKRVSQLERALLDCQNEQKKLLNKNLYLESYSRRDNLKFEGIPEQKSEDCMYLVRDNLSKMGLDPSNFHILRAHRLGQYKKQTVPRPIIFRLANSVERDTVWEKRGALKGSGVWIKEDYPAEIEERRRILWPYVRAARQGDPSNPNVRISAYLRGDKLILNNQSYTTDNIDTLPGFIQSTINNPPVIRKSDEVTIFFTKDCPLSNFHSCEFEIDGVGYLSVEHYLCYQKALLYDTEEVANEIFAMTEPNLQKQRAKRLAKFDQLSWNRKAGDILKTALSAKFAQNENLLRQLISTGDTVIGEACAHDTMFGIGLSLQNPNAMNVARWRGKNLQGTTLMAVRDDLK